MAIHALGKGEQQVQFLLGAPLTALGEMDIMLVFETSGGGSIPSGPANRKRQTSTLKNTMAKPVDQRHRNAIY